MASHPYIGLWVTDDGYIRQQLSADGRYEEARGPRAGAASGRYSVENDRIKYVEDSSGATADGRFEDGVLHHDGMALYRLADHDLNRITAPDRQRSVAHGPTSPPVSASF
jgi:hypothetical protein